MSLGGHPVWGKFDVFTQFCCSYQYTTITGQQKRGHQLSLQVLTKNYSLFDKIGTSSLVSSVVEQQGGPLQGDQTSPPAYTREDAVRHYKMVCKHRRDWVEEREEFGNNDDVVRSYLHRSKD